MTTKTRIKQLEKQKPKVKLTWKEFINADIETIDAHAKQTGGLTWAEYIADKDKPNTSQNSGA